MPHENSTIAEPLQIALTALKETTGLTASVATNGVAEQDGLMTITLPDGHALELAYDVKANIDRRDQLSTFQCRQNGTILITQSLSTAMAEECRQRNLQFLDASGNCFLHQPGLFVFVSGRKAMPAGKQAAARGLTPAVLRLMFAALSQPTILAGNVRHIAEIASISHGAAGNALVMLEEIGLIGKTAAGRRVLLLPERWLDVWTEGYLGRIRPKLVTYRMSSSLPLAALLERVSPAMHEVILGGEAAARQLELGLKPDALTLYVDPHQATTLPHLVQTLRLRRDPHGAVEIVEIFWNTRALPSFPIAPEALIYADLIGAGDDRSIETATQLRTRIIDHVARSDR